MTTNRMCRCCGSTVRQTKERIVRGDSGKPNVSKGYFCDPCWGDPHPRLDECLHGLPGPSDTEEGA
jgi:hypothetical protein